MKRSPRIFILATMLLTASLYACEENVRWLSPEDSPERCKDGIDNDENGKTDCQDEQCKQFDHCKTPVNPVPENTEALCKDGIDNDGNQKTDCQDDPCKQFENCQPPKESVPEDTEELCKDGIDNDNNHIADCDEASCKAFTYCIESQTEQETELRTRWNYAQMALITIKMVKKTVWMNPAKNLNPAKMKTAII